MSHFNTASWELVILKEKKIAFDYSTYVLNLLTNDIHCLIITEKLLKYIFIATTSLMVVFDHR